MRLYIRVAVNLISQGMHRIRDEPVQLESSVGLMEQLVPRNAR